MKCVNCGGEAPPVFDEYPTTVDNGWTLDIADLGHYGGFTDFFGYEDSVVHLCHDCCVTLVGALPGLAKAVFRQDGWRGHPSEGGLDRPPCCPYAWAYDPATKEVYLATDGGWRKETSDDGL